jgi:hypothetical protein
MRTSKTEIDQKHCFAAKLFAKGIAANALFECERPGDVTQHKIS